MKEILAVGIDIPGGDVQYVPLTDNQSLADGDIVVIEPDIAPFYGYFPTDSFQGKPSLSESASFRLKEGIQHWQREISSGLAAGKSIFVFLKELQEVFVDTGQRTYSGTGRNRQTTNIVNKVDNYQLLSLPVTIVSSTGKSIKLAPKADIIASFWSEFQDVSEYKVHIDGKVTQPLLVTRDGNRIVGAMLRYKKSPGHLILLPPLTIDTETMTEVKEDGTYWNKKGIAFGKRLTQLLVTMDKQLRSDRQPTPTPPWVSDSAYNLPLEQKLETDLLQLQEEIQTLTSKTKAIQLEILKESSLKRLLYENGSELEDAIHEALQLLGFTTSRFRDSESEFDVVFESKEGRFIGEAEGKDRKPINIDKLRQLDMNILEDLSRDEVDEPAKGVLFGNAFRLQPVEERATFFTDKCISASKRSGVALVRTPDLFLIAQYLKSKQDKRFATACRKAVFAASGSVATFPTIPEPESKKKTKHTTKESSLLTEGALSVES
jgi:hypothetical protein